MQSNVVELPKDAGVAPQKMRDPVSDDQLEKLKQTLAAAMEAQRIYATFNQEQVWRLAWLSYCECGLVTLLKKCSARST